MKTSSIKTPTPSLVISMVVLLIGGLFSAWVYYSVDRSDQNKAASQFGRLADSRINAVERSIEAHIASSHDIASLFHVSDTVLRSNFDAFVKPILERHPGIQALEWIPRINDSVRTSYENRVVREGFPGFQITERDNGSMVPATIRPDYFPVHFVAPYENNKAAFGYDLASNPARKEALIEAIRFNSLTASAAIKLVQETGTQHGVLMFEPLFNSNERENGSENRFFGFVLTVYRMTDLLELSLRDNRGQEVSTSVIDITDSLNHQVLAQFPTANSTSFVSLSEQSNIEIVELSQERLIPIGNRRWLIRCEALPALMVSISSELPFVLLGLCLLLTIISTVLIYLFSNKAAIVSAKVEQRTRQLSLSSEKLAASKAMIESQKFALDQHSIVGITDQRGAIIYVNEKFCEVSKYDREELMGEDHRILNSGHHPKQFFKELWQTISKGLVWHGEIKNRAKDGSSYWVDTTIVPFIDEQSRITQYVSLRADITERKRAEEQIGSTMAALRQSNQELDEFAHIASHDLKEPLRGIHNYSQFLLEDYGEKLDDEGVNKLETLVSLTQRMEMLINSLLEYSGLGRSKMAYVETDLNNIVNDVLESLKIRLNEEKIEVRIPRPLPTIRCDRIRIAEVFRNLISNAIKYGDKPNRWIEISYKDADPTDTHAADTCAVDTVCSLSVSDNGIGIKEEYRESIFRLFKRLHGRDKFGGGTGIGLTIAKKIIERHGGQIWVESDYGVGTSFKFTISGKEYYDENERDISAKASDHADRGQPAGPGGDNSRLQKIGTV